MENFLLLEERKNAGSSGKSSSSVGSYHEEKKFNSGVMKSKSHSFVEMGNSRNNSTVMFNPKMLAIKKNTLITEECDGENNESKIADEERKE